MNYGPLLRATREIRGLTQEEMGEHLGVSRTVVTKMEKDRVVLIFDRALKWFEVTQTQKVVDLLQSGVEIAVIIDCLSTLIGGFIKWF
ncbi:helix-turn-helix domain-containing protein [Siminovitchia terrae]|uniref:helix-turn-helix domain-containing protein n=1 Tax=Siminovitchia terrae TaxID=1914933 RepID=UPI0028A9D7E3|nr:helix-turn-helix transcriptional regulator [Siminovitchia terrae]